MQVLVIATVVLGIAILTLAIGFFVVVRFQQRSVHQAARRAVEEERSRTALPLRAALKTAPLPSGMKRALRIVCGSKVLTEKLGHTNAGAVARPAKIPAAAAAAIESSAAAHSFADRRPGGTDPGSRAAAGIGALPDNASSANATSRAD